MKRSYLKRKTALRAMSVKRQSYQDELAAMTPLVMARCHGLCERCGISAVADIHHRLRRSQGGTNRLSNLAGLCAHCHQRTHNNPAQSYEAGWLLRRTHD